MAEYYRAAKPLVQYVMSFVLVLLQLFQTEKDLSIISVMAAELMLKGTLEHCCFEQSSCFPLQFQ